MSSREGVKKRVERAYVNEYLKRAARECSVEPTAPSEAPDFYLSGAEGSVSLEVRRVFWMETATGSVERRAEAVRLAAMHGLRDAYYALGGRALSAQGRVPEGLARAETEELARRLMTDFGA